jgi:competence protein ComEC
MSSFAAWIGSIPLVAYYFNIITPVSTPANILAVPLCALVLICNLSSLLVAGWLPAAAGLFNHSGWFLMKCIQISSDWFAQLPRAYVYTQAPSLFTTVLYYAVLLGMMTGWLFAPRFRLWKTTALSMAIALWLGITCYQHLAQQLIVLTQPSGYSIFYNAGRGSDLLVDCGTTNAVQSVLKPYLRAQGVNRLPALVLTVGHVSQTAGAVMLADLFKVQQVCTSPARYQSAAYRSTIEKLKKTPARLKILEVGESLGPWEVIHPSAEESSPGADDKPLVLWGKVHQTRVLLMSSLSSVGQDALLERYPGMEADIIVSGLPSRAEPVSDRFLLALRPRLVIICDSKFPARARANLKLHTRLTRTSIPVVYTSEEGATTIDFHRQYWILRTMSGMRVDSRTLTPMVPPKDEQIVSE